jgi:4-hydroxybutyrate CoA-transferase
MTNIKEPKQLTAAAAITHINSFQNVFVHGGCATPNFLLKELVQQANRLTSVTLIHLHTHGDADYLKPQYSANFRVLNLFVGSNVRPYMDFDRVDYIPCFLSEMPSLFKNKVIPLDVALIQVSPPDSHGYCSLGTSVDVVKAAIANSKIVIAQVNNQMPRTFGDALVPVKNIDYLVEHSEPLLESSPKALSSIELEIGRNTADLIENGSTLQMGIGSIPDAVLSSLTSHKDLGIHTEMWSDGALNLLKSGVINNSKKKIHQGKTVSTFVMGSKNVFSFIDNNPSVILLEANYVNNPTVIAKNDKAVSINSAVEIDLTGQVCADSIGHKVISGVGGQIDFIRGSALSNGGKPIIAMTSRTKHGNSRIVSSLKSGAGVVTTRAHVHYVVTEYGAVNLFGKSIHQRARALLDLAHPEDRENLEKAFFEEYSKSSL